MNPPNKMSIVVSLYDNCVSCNENLVAYDKDHKKIEIDTTLVQKEFDRQKAEYDALQYQRDRATSYPSIQDQLDMQYHDTVNGTTTWKDAIAKVKTDNPKPSE